MHSSGLHHTFQWSSSCIISGIEWSSSGPYFDGSFVVGDITFQWPSSVYPVIAVTSQQRLGVSNNQLCCLYNTLFRLTRNNPTKLRIIGHFVRGIHWIQKDSNAESVSMTWRHFVRRKYHTRQSESLYLDQPTIYEMNFYCQFFCSLQ